VLFVRGASPALNRARSMARLREKRLREQVEAPEVGTADKR
jgi:hypothetical protein